MGRTLKIATGVVGMAAFGFGAWPLGAVCFLYLAIVLWPRSFPRLLARHMVAAVMLLLSAMALALGGTCPRSSSSPQECYCSPGQPFSGDFALTISCPSRTQYC